MKKQIISLFMSALIPLSAQTASAENNCLKPRLVVITDIAPANVEPDDMESMVRLLSHADLFEIEAIITSSGWNSSGRKYPEEWTKYLKKAIDAYEKDLPNLMRRSGQVSFMNIKKESAKQKTGYWPSVDYLRSRCMMGSLDFGHRQLSASNNSPGSDFIISLADEKDKRPLFVAIWGGGNTLAQAIWKVREERGEKGVEKFLAKIYAYAITDQDVPWGERKQYKKSSHYWMRKEFGEKLHFIWDESAWLSQNSLGASNWSEYAKHIQGHGHLGAIYPKNKYGVEGDTPSFLHLLPNGLNDPTEPGQIGWGGYFVWSKTLDGETSCYTNTDKPIKKISQQYEKYFYDAAFNNFAARMDWAANGQGNRNPIAVVNGKKGRDAIHIKAKPDKTVRLDAGKSYDPDNDSLSFKWWYLPEAGSFKGTIDIPNAGNPVTDITIPDSAKGCTIHIICEVTDNGAHNLKSYRRVIIDIQ